MDTPTNSHDAPVKQMPYDALRTVTPFSRALTFALFLLLPFLGAFVGHKLGMSYQQLLSSSTTLQLPSEGQIDATRDSEGLYPSYWSYTESITFPLPKWTGEDSILIPFTYGAAADNVLLKPGDLYKNLTFEQDAVFVTNQNTQQDPKPIVRLYPRNDISLEMQLENIVIAEENQPEEFRELFSLETESTLIGDGEMVVLVSTTSPEELFDKGVWTEMSFVVFESFIVGTLYSPQDPESIRVEPNGIQLIN